MEITEGDGEVDGRKFMSRSQTGTIEAGFYDRLARSGSMDNTNTLFNSKLDVKKLKQHPCRQPSSSFSEIFQNVQGQQVLRMKKHAKYNLDTKKQDLKQMVKHFFTFHLQVDEQSQFRMQLVKIFFTFKILKNAYLAHFLLFNFGEKEDNMVGGNVRRVNQRYIDELIRVRHSQEATSMLQVDLQTMLDVNQLLAEFDSKMESVSEEILDFWQNLLNTKETVLLFQQGLRISRAVTSLQELLEELEGKQSNKESKIYLQMASFYKQVIFKSTEYQLMLEKATQACQMKKLAMENREKEQD